MDPQAADAHFPQLTTKQRRFIEEYCVARRRAGANAGTMFNGTKAAIAAGYSRKSAAGVACQNLIKPHIRQAIDARLADLSKRALMQADEVLDRLSRIARVDVPPTLGDTKSAGEIIKSLELLGKYHKLWTEKQEVSGLDGKPIQFALPTMEDSEDPHLPEETPTNGTNHSNG